METKLYLLQGWPLLNIACGLISTPEALALLGYLRENLTGEEFLPLIGSSNKSRMTLLHTAARFSDSEATVCEEILTYLLSLSNQFKTGTIYYVIVRYIVQDDVCFPLLSCL